MLAWKGKPSPQLAAGLWRAYNRAMPWKCGLNLMLRWSQRDLTSRGQASMRKTAPLDGRPEAAPQQAKRLKQPQRQQHLRLPTGRCHQPESCSREMRRRWLI